MNNLTKHETVWLQAYCAARKSGTSLATCSADNALNDFKLRFPPSPPPKEESKGVYVTREMLAKAWDERVWQPHQQGGIGSTLRSEAFKLFCKDLGLSE